MQIILYLLDWNLDYRVPFNLLRSLATKHILKLFVYVRSRRNLYIALGLVTVIFAFIPYMFTTSVTFAIALIGISLLPTDRQIHKRRLKSNNHTS